MGVMSYATSCIRAACCLLFCSKRSWHFLRCVSVYDSMLLYQNSGCSMLIQNVYKAQLAFLETVPAQLRHCSIASRHTIPQLPKVKQFLMLSYSSSYSHSSDQLLLLAGHRQQLLSIWAAAQGMAWLCLPGCTCWLWMWRCSGVTLTRSLFFFFFFCCCCCCCCCCSIPLHVLTRY